MILYCRLFIGRGNELVVILHLIISIHLSHNTILLILIFTNNSCQFTSTNMPKEKPLRAVASENYLLNTNALVQLQVSMMISNVI